jgi:hypothetical protein
MRNFSFATRLSETTRKCDNPTWQKVLVINALIVLKGVHPALINKTQIKII